MSVTLVKHCVVLLLFTLIACILLYPLPLQLSNGLLAAQSGDPLMQVWVVQWNIHKLTTSLASYFDANIFYPYPNTFAYHDHLFVLGLVGLPIFVFTHNPILTYNILLMLSFILSAYGMYVLARAITRNDYAALLAGLIFGFLPYRFAHLDHLNLLSIQWLPFGLLFLIRYFTSSSVSRRTVQRSDVLNLVLFWTFFLLQALTAFNYLAMLTLTVGVFVVGMMIVQWRTPGVQTSVCQSSKLKFALLIIGGLLVGLLLLPFMLPYHRANQEMGFQRTIQEAESLSARFQDYLVAPEDNLLYGKITQKFKSPTSPFPREQILFYGILPGILALLGIWSAWRKETRFLQKNLVSSVFIILFIIAGILSLGPAINLFGKRLPLPYAWLYQYVPGFKALRVPARFGLLVFFALTVLAAIGFVYLTESLKRSKRHLSPALKNLIATGLIGGIILLEYFSTAKQLSFYPGTRATIPAVYQWLAEQPEATRMIELPVRSAKDNFEYTYFSTFHWKQMVNGRSAFIPHGISQIFGEMRNFPSQRTIDLLQCLGIRYVILHTDKLDAALPATLPDNIQFLHSFDADLVLEIAAQSSDLSAKTAGLDLQYQIPLALQPDDLYNIGLSLKSEAQNSICPLPQEKAHIQIKWTDQKEKTIYQESQSLPLPLLIQPEESMTLSMNFKTPATPDDYRVTLYPETAFFAQQTATMRITITPEVLDSRRPGKLRVEFVKTDIPDVWEKGKPLPVRVFVKNTGDTLWRSRVADRKHPVGEVHLGIVDWREVASGVSLKDSHQQLFLSRGFLPYDVSPGKEVWITTEIRTPDLPGEYWVELDLVSELIQWFANQDSLPLTKKIILK